ncbi:insecticidal delta-endotoxin Cry8Ea1 family protein, partial [Bacillus toyonensis]|uniref:insecticidal delta-endotoxin Cry8Ea1 family protein n=1 Tax=Bacillus toyonensis TaxID=155322 RepID=UPI002E1FBA72
MKQNYNDEYDIIDNGGRGDQSRYPLTNAPSAELQDMNYIEWLDNCTLKEQVELFRDTSTTVRDALATTAGIITALLSVSNPAAAATAGIITILIPQLWPSGSDEVTWEKFMAAAEILIQKQITEAVRNKALTELEGVYRTIRLYQLAAERWNQNKNDPQAQESIRTQFRATNTIIEFAMPSFRVAGFEVPLLNVYAEAANLQLALLRDAVKFGRDWGLPQDEVDDIYSEQLLPRIAEHTDHCVTYFNRGLEEAKKLKANLNDYARYPWAQYINHSKIQGIENWNLFNDYRRNMTILVLDLVALWPTYDPRRYSMVTKSELTRELYTSVRGAFYGHNNDYDQNFEEIERNIISPPHLVTWPINFTVYTQNDYYYPMAGLQHKFNYTESIVSLESPVTGVTGTSNLINFVTADPFILAVTIIGFGQLGTSLGIYAMSFGRKSGSISHVGDIEIGTDDYLDIVDRIPVGDSTPNKLSWMSAAPTTLGSTTFLQYVSYAWRHPSVDSNNRISIDKITQIPAVKAFFIDDNHVKVIKGPGSTGGDLVAFSREGYGLSISVFIPGSDLVSFYRVRIRYASSQSAKVTMGFGGGVEESESKFNFPATYSGGNLTYNSFGYINTLAIASQSTAQTIEVYFRQYEEAEFIVDKLEFIPMEMSLEEYQADQDLEKARKAVNALFTSDAKSELKVNITDYAVDQAANLVECVSEDFHAQEKRILLDQVKFAKRLSQARNLLNYGDFESLDWSGENGWRTSPHVHVASDNPIFKGRYLHMPGAMSPQFSNNIYPTYAYQKVDESKLKSYTRYLVRGFVGNSKDLELLVERYGKEVHVEMDVPNDMQYTLPMNECGGFERCGKVSYQAVSDHTCTCKDTARMNTDCQCKDKINHMTTGVYTSMPVGSAMYPDGYHAHKSCKCGDKTMYGNGKHPHKSCGCKDPHVFSYHIDTGCVDQEENLGLWFALKIASENGVANIDNLEIIEALPLTGEALARVKKREHKWKQEMEQKRCKTEEAVQAAQTAINTLFTNTQYNRLKFETLFPHILHADELVQRIPYVYHPFL